MLRPSQINLPHVGIRWQSKQHGIQHTSPWQLGNHNTFKFVDLWSMYCRSSKFFKHIRTHFNCLDILVHWVIFHCPQSHTVQRCWVRADATRDAWDDHSWCCCSWCCYYKIILWWLLVMIYIPLYNMQIIYTWTLQCVKYMSIDVYRCL